MQFPGDVVGQSIVERLHNEPSGDSAHTLALGIIPQLVDVDFLRFAFFDDLFAVVELKLGHKIALGTRGQPGQDGKHRCNLKSVRSDVCAEIRVAQDFFINPDLFAKGADYTEP